MEKNYYNILDITDEEKALKFEDFEPILKKKYKKKCIQYHPDKQVGKTEDERKIAEDKFKDISEAYSVLSDKAKKQQYDTYGTIGDDGFMDMNDIFSRFNGFNPFGGFGGFGRTNRQPMKGTDITIQLQCTLKDIYKGVSKTIRYKKEASCPDCNGTGSKDGKSTICPHCNGAGVIQDIQQSNGFTQIRQYPCTHCHGNGYIKTNLCESCHGSGIKYEDIEYTVKLPNTLIDNNGIIKIRGYGNNCHGQANVPPGDLIIQLVLSPNDEFELERNGLDIRKTINVDIIDCLLGNEQEVVGIDGKLIKFKIPRGTKDNSVLNIRKKGMSNGNNDFGDLHVVIKHIIPTALNDEEIKLLETLKTKEHFKLH